jgi:transcriptional regulator with XRE-family HTH domain
MCKLHKCQGEIFDMHKEIGRRVKQVREYFHLTRKQFIQIIKVDLSTVSRIETGKQGPSEVFLDALLARFLINPDWVKSGEGEMFITSQEHIANGIKFLGVQKYGQGLVKILDDQQFAELQSFVAMNKFKKENFNDDLQELLQQVLNLWQQGDERTRKTLVQLVKALPGVGENEKNK